MLSRRTSPHGSRDILSAASQLATNMGHNYVGTEHLLLALIRDDSAVATQAIAVQLAQQYGSTNR